MKLEMVLAGEEPRVVEVREEGGRYLVSIQDPSPGEAAELEVDFDDSAGVVHLRTGSRSRLIEVSERDGTWAAGFGPYRLEARLYTAEQRLRDQLDARSQARATAIEARMPGKVLEVFVEAGAEVAEGDRIAVLEAMKMENVIRAPARGIIAAVGVSRGETVQAGQTIVEFEAS